MTDKQIKEVFKNGFYCIEPCPEIKELQAKLKRKEQECEELKKQLELNTANAVVIDMAQRLYKLKQTFTEIKEIAEKEVNNRMLFADKESFCDFNKILQKCEVIKE